jgi:hypothetical protein
LISSEIKQRNETCWTKFELGTDRSA